MILRKDKFLFFYFIIKEEHLESFGIIYLVEKILKLGPNT